MLGPTAVAVKFGNISIKRWFRYSIDGPTEISHPLTRSRETIKRICTPNFALSYNLQPSELSLHDLMNGSILSTIHAHHRHCGPSNNDM